MIKEKPSQSDKELPLERLATTDEKGKRVFLYPADVRGNFKKLRLHVHNVLLVMFLVLPWIQINGHQAVLLDIAHRKFIIFGLTFWAHDAPKLFFVFASVLVGISLITAILGRMWCGWACPETVFTENVYRRVERWIEGNAVQRRRLAKAPWSFNKFKLKGFKWFVFTLITLLITHSFLAYFIGVEELAKMMSQSPVEHPKAFTFMAATTAILLFAFGSFREQFCIILCPYGRFQSVLLDENSLVVAYDEARGEPRRGTDDNSGDCINCYRCVDVCPTGIDIRRGLQMECIACTACIDACDEVMDRVKKPHGLIRYSTEANLNNKPNQHIRPRVIVLSMVLLVLLSGLSYILLTRPNVKVDIFNARGKTYQLLKLEKQTLVMNQFVLNAANYTFDDAFVQLEAADPKLKDQIILVIPNQKLLVKAGLENKQPFFIKFPKELLEHGQRYIQMKIKAFDAQEHKWTDIYEEEVHLAGPY